MSVTAPQGFRASGVTAGLKASGAPDLALVVNDGPGFVSNRVLMLTVNEAAGVVDRGTADAPTVDEVFTSCFGHALGPLATADLIGLDTVLDSLHVLREHTGDDRLRDAREQRRT